MCVHAMGNIPSFAGELKLLRDECNMLFPLHVKDYVPVTKGFVHFVFLSFLLWIFPVSSINNVPLL